MKQKIFIFLILLFFLHLGFRIYSYRDNYFSRYDPKYWNYRYEHSQWIVPVECSIILKNKKSKDYSWCVKHKAEYKKQILLGDDGLYAYTGWEYINGRDPTTLNAEIPPFGKYLIGLSIILFGNQNVFALSCGIIALLALYLLNLRIVKNKLLAFLPVFAFSLEPLFYTQLNAPFLDLLYLALLLFTFLFILKRKYILASIFLGLMASTKSSLSTFIVVGATILIYLLLSEILEKNRKKWKFSEIKKFLLSFPIAGLVFLMTYAVFFIHGNNLRQFLGVQKWILGFYFIGVKGSILTVWQMLLIGRWDNWFGPSLQVKEWYIGWGILLMLSLYQTYVFIIKRNFDEKTLCLIWIIIYLSFLSIIPVWPRYLLLLLPFMYNLAIWSLAKNITRSS